jgi:hypothetical protein
MSNTLSQVKKEESNGGFWSSVGNGLLSAASSILPMLLDPEEPSSEIDSSTSSSTNIDKDCYVLQIQRAIRVLQKLQAVADLDVISQFVNLLSAEVADQRLLENEFTTPTKAITNAALRDTPDEAVGEAHLTMTDRTITRVQHNIALKNFAKVNKLKAKGLKPVHVPCIESSLANQISDSVIKLNPKSRASTRKDPQKL